MTKDCDKESPLGIETDDQLWEHIDHSLAQINEGKVAPAKTASQRLRLEYNLKVLDAMAEAKSISHDPAINGFESMESLKAALDSRGRRLK